MCLIVLVQISYVFADNKKLELQIPSQSLLSALRDFQRQSKIQILFVPAAIVQAQSPPLSGYYDIDEALSTLLGGTELKYTRDNTNFVLIKPLVKDEKDLTEELRDVLTLEEILVTGYRGSLRVALREKRQSQGITEFISTTEIGKLPDVTIADSLTRLPGLGAERDRGQTATLSIRGFGPRFGYTSVNGREIVTAEDDRSARYEQFPSELVHAVRVTKSFSADMEEGGISGSIDLQTLRPLDLTERALSFSGGYLRHPTGKTLDTVGDEGTSGYRFSGLFADRYRDGELGIVIGYTAQRQPVTVNGLEGFGFGGPSVGDLNNDGNDDTGITGLDIFAVRGANDRQGLLASVAWQPSSEFKLSYDFLNTLFDIRESTAEFFTFSSPAYNYISADITTTDAVAGSVLIDDFTNAGAGTSFGSVFTRKNQFWSNGLKFEWKQDSWSAVTDISHSQAKRASRFAAVRSFFKTDTAPYTLSYNYFGEPFLSSSLDLADASNYQIDSLIIQPERNVEDQHASITSRLKHRLDRGWFQSVEFGGRYLSRKKTFRRWSYSQLPLDRDGDGTVDLEDTEIDPSFASSATNGSLNLPEILTLDFDSVVSAYFGGIAPVTEQPVTSFDQVGTGSVEERSYAGYVRLDISGEMGSQKVTGDIGIRLVQTDVAAQGNRRDLDDLVTPVTEQNSYFDVLPSLNLKTLLSRDLILQFGLARTMSRPPLSELVAGIDLTDESSGLFIGSNGNTKLDPYRANQMDLSLEWYFASESIFSVAVFWKDLQSSIGRDRVAITSSGTTAILTRPVNTPGGVIQGLELAYQQSFRQLPEPFNRLGVAANYAFTDSNLREVVGSDSVGSSGSLGLTGLSRYVAFASLYYTYWPFEATVGYNYRSAYTRQFREDLDLTINDSEATWDLSLSYDATDRIKLIFQAQNLGNYNERSYFGSDPNNLERYREFSRRYFIGLQVDI